VGSGRRSTEGLFIVCRWVIIFEAFCLAGDKDGYITSEVEAGVRGKSRLVSLSHVVNGLSGGGDLERLGSMAKVAFTYGMHEGAEEMDSMVLVKSGEVGFMMNISPEAMLHLTWVECSTPVAWSC
jgi:hypothetical protein